MPALRAHMEQAAGLWIAWPKRASGVPTDLTEDVVRELALANRLVDNKVCAIDETWSGLRLVIRLTDRVPSGSMTEPLPEDQRLTEISSKAYEHPADRAATAALQSIPMLDQVVRKLIEYGYERALRQVFMAGSVKLGSDQLPDIWAAHRAALARLDITELPDLYLTQFPVANAAAIGAGRPMVVVNSRPGQPPRRARDAHRARPRGGAHPLRPRALPDGADDPAVGLAGWPACRCSPGLPLIAVRMALLEWFRAAELSCDRAAHAGQPRPARRPAGR